MLVLGLGSGSGFFFFHLRRVGNVFCVCVCVCVFDPGRDADREDRVGQVRSIDVRIGAADDIVVLPVRPH